MKNRAYRIKTVKIIPFGEIRPREYYKLQVYIGRWWYMLRISASLTDMETIKYLLEERNTEIL